MKVQKLYGCLNTETGELQGSHKCRERKYAYVMKQKCIDNFQNLLQKDKKYKIVEFIPVIIGNSKEQNDKNSNN